MPYFPGRAAPLVEDVARHLNALLRTNFAEITHICTRCGRRSNASQDLGAFNHLSKGLDAKVSERATFKDQLLAADIDFNFA